MFFFTRFAFAGEERTLDGSNCYLLPFIFVILRETLFSFYNSLGCMRRLENEIDFLRYILYQSNKQTLFIVDFYKIKEVQMKMNKFMTTCSLKYVTNSIFYESNNVKNKVDIFSKFSKTKSKK